MKSVLPAFATWRSWMPRVLFESALIVLSVLLALFLDEWRRERHERSELSFAIRAIQAEVMENKAAVELARARHSATHDSLTVYAERGELPPARIYYGGIFNPAGVLNVAWQTAQQGGSIPRLPYDVRLLLSRTDRQSAYRALGDAIAQSVYAEVARHGGESVFRDGYANFILLTRDFANRERGLAEAYDSVLVTLNRTM
jgi:hypothetical protein